MSDFKRKQLRIVVSGLVQGVWYRASACSRARQMGLFGRVWNRVDGKVEIVAEGSASALQDFLIWCAQGPPGARVEGLESYWSDPSGGFDDFRISYDV
ncbi:MAG: acylphosphatase [Deltaproteobacteria bacterium]|nr:acylphosphatase [Deltaproteobacteria bacterium]